MRAVRRSVITIRVRLRTVDLGRSRDPERRPLVSVASLESLEQSFDTVLVVDFGAQYAQLIARRVRECHVFSEIVPSTMPVEQMLAKRPKAIILSGGPASVYEPGAPPAPAGLCAAGGLRGDGSHRQRTGRRDGRRRARFLRRAIPPGGAAHRPRHGGPQALLVRRRRLPAIFDDGQHRRKGRRRDPRAGGGPGGGLRGGGG